MAGIFSEMIHRVKCFHSYPVKSIRALSFQNAMPIQIHSCNSIEADPTSARRHPEFVRLLAPFKVLTRKHSEFGSLPAPF